MDLLLNSVWQQLCDKGTYAAFMPLLLGGIFAAMRHWLISEDDFVKRARLVSSKCEDKIANSLKNCIDDPLAPGCFASFAKSTSSAITQSREVERLRRVNHLLNRALMLVTISGVPLLAVGLIFVSARPYVALLSFVVLMSQIWLGVKVRGLVRVLELHEEAP